MQRGSVATLTDGGGARAAPGGRLAWLDLWRGACVVGMIETHVLNTFLVASAQATGWFRWLTYFDGLIAPAFLFIAGYAQGMGMRAAEGARRGWGKKLRRLGAVWLLGYALHFPAPQLFAGQWSEAWRLGTVVDVLQCIAVSLAVLLAAERWARRWVDAIAAVLLVLAVLGEGAAAAWDSAPRWWLAYFNTSTGSLFPLLPWMGFVGAGFLASAWPRLVPLVVAATLGWLAPGAVGFFFERLAWLVAAVPVFAWIAGRWQPQWLLFLGRESLVCYAAHLLLIETLAVTMLPRQSFGLAGSAGLFVAVLAATMLLATGWRRVWRHK